MNVDNTENEGRWEYTLLLLIIPVVFLTAIVLPLTPIGIFSIDSVEDPLYLIEYYSVGSVPFSWVLVVILIFLLCITLIIPLTRILGWNIEILDTKFVKTFLSLIFTICIFIIQNMVRDSLTKNPLFVRGVNLTDIISYNISGGIPTELINGMGLMLFDAAIAISLVVQIVYADNVASEEEKWNIFWLSDRVSQLIALTGIVLSLTKLLPLLFETLSL